MTEATKLETITAVTVAIQRVIEADDFGRQLKSRALRLRACRLADLHEMRAQLFAEADLSRVPADMLQDLSEMRARAVQKDRDSVRFWRKEAE